MSERNNRNNNGKRRNGGNGGYGKSSGGRSGGYRSERRNDRREGEGRGERGYRSREARFGEDKGRPGKRYHSDSHRSEGGNYRGEGQRRNDGWGRSDDRRRSDSWRGSDDRRRSEGRRNNDGWGRSDSRQGRDGQRSTGPRREGRGWDSRPRRDGDRRNQGRNNDRRNDRRFDRYEDRPKRNFREERRDFDETPVKNVSWNDGPKKTVRSWEDSRQGAVDWADAVVSQNAFIEEMSMLSELNGDSDDYEEVEDLGFIDDIYEEESSYDAAKEASREASADSMRALLMQREQLELMMAGATQEEAEEEAEASLTRKVQEARLGVQVSESSDAEVQQEAQDALDDAEAAEEPAKEVQPQAPDIDTDAVPKSDVIYGRNPVTEALKSGRDIEKIFVQENSGGAAGRVLSLARKNNVVVERVTKAALDRIAEGGSHQGIIAVVSAHEYAEMDDIFALAEERGEDPFIIILDGIEDPQNLGAILRTAECAGAHGVIIQKRRAAGLTETAVKTSAGAVEYIPCVRETNIARTIESLKERGVWVYGCDMDGENYTDTDLTGSCAIVIGAEGDGVSQIVREKCDRIVSIPLKGHINSLNASNAGAVLMYEIRRQRDAK